MLSLDIKVEYSIIDDHLLKILQHQQGFVLNPVKIFMYKHLGSVAACYNRAPAVASCLMSLVWASLKGPQLECRLPTGAKI